MRLLIASHNSSHVGGVETYIDGLVPALAARGCAVAVWHEQGTAGSDPSGVPRWFHQDEGGSFAKATAWSPDLVFTHGLRSPALERRLLAIAPAITFAHSYLGTCVSGNKMHAFPDATPCTRVFGAACLALYYPRRCGGWSPATALDMYRRQSERLALLGCYRAILVGSQYMADEYARHGLAAKTRVVSLPTPPFEAPCRRARAAGPWQLLYLGRLEWTKGADIAVDAAAQVASQLATPVTLALAGSGSMEQSLRARADRLHAGESRVRYEFLGSVSADARSRLLQGTDLLLVPSRWPEPFGLVGNEAGSHGVPAVAFAAGGIPEWLDDGVNGRLVRGRPGPHGFARAIADVLADPVARSSMGDAARGVAGRYSIERHLRELDDIFRTVLMRPAR